jgi:HK97 gp10 family phage protein
MGKAAVLTIEGLEDLRQTFQIDGPTEARNLARATVYGIAVALAGKVQSAAPVRTGDLKKGIKAVRRRGKPNFPVSEVRAIDPQHDLRYWHFEEFGTKHQAAAPFVTPVVEQERSKLPQTYRDEFGVKLEKSLARKARKAAKIAGGET